MRDDAFVEKGDRSRKGRKFMRYVNRVLEATEIDLQELPGNSERQDSMDRFSPGSHFALAQQSINNNSASLVIFRFKQYMPID